MNEQELFELVHNCYAEANKEYLLQQIEKASIYLTDEQKEQLAEWIAKQKCDGCNDEPYDDKHGTCKYCMAKKTEQIREWLKQPHRKENEK